MIGRCICNQLRLRDVEVENNRDACFIALVRGLSFWHVVANATTSISRFQKMDPSCQEAARKRIFRKSRSRSCLGAGFTSTEYVKGQSSTKHTQGEIMNATPAEHLQDESILNSSLRDMTVEEHIADLDRIQCRKNALTAVINERHEILMQLEAAGVQTLAELPSGTPWIR
jgi:hypothetical protein